jgi:hypothetical protein
MRDQQPIRTARRKQRQEEREKNGVAVAACVLCIEEHHTAGRRHDPQLTDSLCEKHHRAVHEDMRRAGVSLSFDPDPKKRIANALRSVAVYDRSRAAAMERWAASLEGAVDDEEPMDRREKK